MKNIVVYTTKNSSVLADVLAQIEDVNVRVENASKLRDYETLNAGLLVIENVPDIKDVLMVTKFKTSVLFIGEPFKGATVRAVTYDLIKTPIDNDELLIRAKSLLKVKELKDRIIQTIKTIYDPEIPVNIWDMGLIYNIDIDDDYFVLIEMTLTAPNCPEAESLPREVEEKVKQVDGVQNLQVKLVFEPEWDIRKLSDEAKLELGLL